MYLLSFVIKPNFGSKVYKKKLSFYQLFAIILQVSFLKYEFRFNNFHFVQKITFAYTLYPRLTVAGFIN